MPNELRANYTFGQFLRATVALTRSQLLLAARERTVLFFNYVFPLVFFFGFGLFVGGRGMGSAMTRVVSMVIVLGILGSGLFGAGLRAVADRETGILRRYRLAPITPLPILISSIIAGWILYLPSGILVILLSHALYQMPLPAQPVALLAVITLGCFAFRAMGLIIAAVANSAAESNVMVQLLYIPMLFLSGATFPISAMPFSAQIVSQFLPASYLNSGIHHVMLQAGGLAAIAQPAGALILTTVLAVFIANQIFRWEKEETVAPRAKAWVAAVLLPFVALGGYQASSHGQINEAKRLDRQIRRSQARLVRGAMIFTGDGGVIPNGALLIRNGKIAEVLAAPPADAASLDAEIIEGAGKTVIPGLIDAQVRLGSRAAIGGGAAAAKPAREIEHALAAYLYSGITAVRSTSEFDQSILAARALVNPGALLGAELFTAGPVLVATDASGARQSSPSQPRTPAEAREMVARLKALGAGAVEAVLDEGLAAKPEPGLERPVFLALAEAARKAGLPLAVRAGNRAEVQLALEGHPASIERASSVEPLPQELFARMAKDGVVFIPALAAAETLADGAARRADFLGVPLVQQVVKQETLDATRQAFLSGGTAGARLGPEAASVSAAARENLRRAWRAGAPLAVGTDSGTAGLFHGPALHRELKLWTEAGIPIATALEAATARPAALLKAAGRLGALRPGAEATVIILEGNPLLDISVTERISAIIFKGELVSRADLFDQR